MGSDGAMVWRANANLTVGQSYLTVWLLWTDGLATTAFFNRVARQHISVSYL